MLYVICCCCCFLDIWSRSSIRSMPSTFIHKRRILVWFPNYALALGLPLDVGRRAGFDFIILIEQQQRLPVCNNAPFSTTCSSACSHNTSSATFALTPLSKSKKYDANYTRRRENKKRRKKRLTAKQPDTQSPHPCPAATA